MIRALALVAYLAYLAAPATAKELTNGEKARLLRAFAAPQLAALLQAQQIAEASRAIPSFGACVRTTEVEQAALT